MEKSLFTHEYREFTRLLRELREQAGLTQTALAERVGQSQSYISKWERGDLRLDLVQLRALCRAMGVSLPAFVTEFDTRVAKRKR